MTMRTNFALGGLAALLFASTTWADTIYTSAGKVIEEVTIQSEGLENVVYKSSGGNERKVPSVNVLRIDFETEPRVFGRAAASLEDDDLESAITYYADYVDAIIKGKTKEKRQKWAPANAAWRVIGLYESIGDLAGVAKAAGIVIANFSDSRYMPFAYMAKARAEYSNGDAAKAQETLGAFRSVIEGRQLSERWGIECGLALVLTDDSLVGPMRRKELAQLAKRAGTDFETVKSRAIVAMGESALADAVAKRGLAKDLINEALGYFQTVIANPLADEETLAGAYAGQGDCLFQVAASTSDKAKLKEALLSFLRVAAVYPEQVRYVPKCLFYAGRCFDLMEDKESSDRAQQLYSQVWFLYSDSPWANEAKNFRRR